MVFRPKATTSSAPHPAFGQQLGECVGSGRLGERAFNPNGESRGHRGTCGIRVLRRHRDHDWVIRHLKRVGHSRPQAIGQIKTLNHFRSFEFCGHHEIHQQQKDNVDHRSEVEGGSPIRPSIAFAFTSTLGPPCFDTHCFGHLLARFKRSHQGVGSSRTRCTLASAPSTRALAVRKASKMG